MTTFAVRARQGPLRQKAASTLDITGFYSISASPAC
jgi:hypothetical protein